MSTEAGLELLKALGGTIGSIGGKLLMAFGAFSGAWATYQASGLPVPATLYQVEQKLVPVQRSINGLEANQLVGQRSIIRLTRASLRNERGANERALRSTDQAAKVTIGRRNAEIDDQLRDLEREDAELVAQVKVLKPDR